MHQSLEIACNDIDFQIHRAARLVVAENGLFPGLRDDREFEAGAVDLIYRKAGAIDANTALHGDIARQVFWRRDRHPPKARILDNALNMPHPVDVAADQVPTEGCLKR